MMKCNICGDLFNPGYLDQVAEHEHSDIKIKTIIKGKKVIKNAWEVYPNCPPEFACGVHTYLNGEDCPKRPCADELIQGYYSAERDLKDNYTLNSQP